MNRYLITIGSVLLASSVISLVATQASLRVAALPNTEAQLSAAPAAGSTPSSAGEPDTASKPATRQVNSIQRLSSPGAGSTKRSDIKAASPDGRAETDPASLEPWTDYGVIAHAMGGIDGKDYTNSLDAFRNSYKKGFRVFETDLILSADNELVARHDWGTYLQPSLPADEQEKALPQDEFMKYKIFDEFRPLNLQKIIQLLKNKPDMYLITDTKEIDPAVIKDQFQLLVDQVKAVDASILHRIIPEIYNHEMYDIVNAIYPFPNQIYSIYLTEEPQDEILQFVADKQIPVVAMQTDQASKEFVEALTANHVIPYIYTVNDTHEVEEYRSWGVQGFYTDFLTPDELKEPENPALCNSSLIASFEHIEPKINEQKRRR
jgi:glycerophosphoryl diester phosphodiesterase